MLWLKQYLSLLIPLVALLVGIESVLLINRAVASHEEVIGKSYAMVLVAKSKMAIEDITDRVPEALALEELDSSDVLNEINSTFKDPIFDGVKNTLPYFYSIKFKSFPNQFRIKVISKYLSNLDNVTRVESFSRSHNQIYKILVLIKGCVITLSTLIFILSTLLMIKQIEVWRFEHSERMEIMTYLGAPSKFKNGPLYKLAIVDSLVASVVVLLFAIIIYNNSRVDSIMKMLGINIFGAKDLLGDFSILILSSCVVSLISVFMVILFQKEP